MVFIGEKEILQRIARKGGVLVEIPRVEPTATEIALGRRIVLGRDEATLRILIVAHERRAISPAAVDIRFLLDESTPLMEKHPYRLNCRRPIDAGGNLEDFALHSGRGIFDVVESR